MKSSKLTASAAALALCFALTACGGGGISSTPTPTPTPAPTPTPTPTPTYTPVAQITGDHTYQTAGTTFVLSPLSMTDAGPLDFTTGVDIEYDASDDLYLLKLPNGTRIGYGPDELVSTDPMTGEKHYRLDVTGLEFDSDLRLLVPRVNSVALSYTFIGRWHFDYGGKSWEFVAGVPTLAGDMPKSGTATYTVALAEGTAFDSTFSEYDLFAGGSTGTFSANFAAGTISTSLNLLGEVSGSSTIRDFGAINGTGTIAASSPEFSGTLGQAGGTGAFSGAFFGPKALEMGYSFYFSGSDFNAVGLVAGKKN